MKNKILTFIIGVLVGAIITTAGFLIYSKSMNKNAEPMMMQMEDKGPMQRPDENMENPLEKTEGDKQEKMQNNI